MRQGDQVTGFPSGEVKRSSVLAPRCSRIHPHIEHVLAGWGSGHGPTWKQACERLGLRRALAAGQCYLLASIAPEIRAEVARLAAALIDGHPAFLAALSPVKVAPAPKPCPAGVGVKGGTSRGKGSGSRPRLWICDCPKPVKVRVASDNFDATCNACGQRFRLAQSV